MFKKVTFGILLGAFVLGIFYPRVSFAQSKLLQDKQEVLKAKVVNVISEKQENIPGTENTGILQRIRIQLLSGDKKGTVLEMDNDYISLKEGQIFYVVHTIRADDGTETYVVGDIYRLPWLLFFVGLFLVLVCIFGGIQGIRGILSLIISLLVISFALLPGVLHGFSPIILTIGCASAIIILGSYITHGFNKTTTSAVIGMIVTVIITGFIAWFAVKMTSLSGFSSEESVYLNFDTNGTIDFVGLLFGGIMIGLLGVLYDIAIGQAISVEELFRAGSLHKKTVYKRAIRIGREHIGALVNTLAIAYVGASLPLLLLFYSGSYLTFEMIINKEIFATEIIRTLVGSIGLMLAVPITTIISVFMLEHLKGKAYGEDELRSRTHSHTHSH